MTRSQRVGMTPELYLGVWAVGLMVVGILSSELSGIEMRRMIDSISLPALSIGALLVGPPIVLLAMRWEKFEPKLRDLLLGALVGGVLIGGVLGGYSLAWWLNTAFDRAPPRTASAQVKRVFHGKQTSTTYELLSPELPGDFNLRGDRSQNTVIHVVIRTGLFGARWVDKR